jgi:hypothetical protein
MGGVTHTAPATQTRRLDVTARSETVRGGEVRPVYMASAWLKRPARRENGWHGAELVIEGTGYAAESFHTDDGEGRVWQIVDLRKDGGTHYRLTFGPDGDLCDCPHRVFRGVTRKHAATVRAALDWLETRERLQWEAAAAARALRSRAILAAVAGVPSRGAWAPYPAASVIPGGGGPEPKLACGMITVKRGGVDATRRGV